MPQNKASSKAPWHPERLAARLPFLAARSALTRATRRFFDAAGYTEVETPCAVAAPGEEVHLRALATRALAPVEHGEPALPLWLATSPEFAMKRLLVGGSGPIFQLARVWRDELPTDLHAREFTLLEWYRPDATLSSLMHETEAYLRQVLPAVLPGRHVAIDQPFERLTMAEAFARHAGADLLGTADDAAALARSAGATLRHGETWEDLFFRLLLEHVEPRIGRARPTFLTHWPAAQAALARRDPAEPRQALRFELYLGGIELANAFEELTDPAEQRARFLADRAQRARVHADDSAGRDWPLDEDFLAALQHGLPPCAGIALGFDRLAMLASGATRIDQVQWLPATEA